MENPEAYNPRTRVLRENFFLEDNPFNPERDPTTGFDFRKNNARLIQELNVFQVNRLKDYFYQVGGLESQIKKVADYLDTYEYPQGGGVPPAILIEGDSGVGRSSMAYYIAFMIQDRRAPDTPSPSLRSVRVIGSHFGKHLMNIKTQIELHSNEHNAAGCKQIFEIHEKNISPTDPEEAPLVQMFENLRPCMEALPPLILIIEPIEYGHKDWIARLHGMLSPMKILPVFLTKDENPNLFDIFEDLVKNEDISGVAIHLDGLGRDAAAEFLRRRIRRFRKGDLPANTTDLFPFATQSLQQALGTQDRIPIKRLLNYLRGALRSKLEEVSRHYERPDEQPSHVFSEDELLISWDNFYQGVVSETRRAVQRR